MSKSVVSNNYNEDFGPSFQRHILAVIARVPGFALRCRAVLSHRYFVADTHRVVAEVLLAHLDKHSKLPTKPTLIEEMRLRVGTEEMEPIEGLLADIYREDVQDHAAVSEKVIAFGKRQAMLNAVIEGAERIDKGDPEGVEPLIRKAMLVGEDLTNLGTDYIGELGDRLLKYRTPETQRQSKIPTGIAHVDHLMKGGLARRALGVLLAPPKRGKSTCLINIGFGALTDLDGLNVLHYTCEMSESDVIRRYDDRLMGQLVREREAHPVRFTEQLEKRIKRAVHGKLIVKEYPTRTATVDTLRSHISILASQGMMPDLVIVDYAGIMKPTNRRAGDYRLEQASIFEDLRALAGEFDCAVWTAQQANRGSLDKETVTMADVAETFEVAAVCDAMFALCQTNDERADGVCRLFSAAIRSVEDGITVNCKIDRTACRVTSTNLEDVSRSRIYTHLDADFEDVNANKPTEAGEPEKKAAPSKAAALATARRVTGMAAPKPSTEPRRRQAAPTKKVPK